MSRALSRKLKSSMSHMTLTTSHQGSTPTCLYHSIAKIFLHNVFLLGYPITDPELQKFLYTCDHMPELIDIPPPDTPLYEEYIKVCMFLYVYYIVSTYYTLRQTEPSIAHVPAIVYVIKLYINGGVRAGEIDALESYPNKRKMESTIPLELMKHAAHIRQFFKDTKFDTSRINVIEPMQFGSIQHFGEQVMAKYPDEYFLVHIELSRSEIGHGVIMRNFRDSSMIIQNSWGDTPTRISTTLLNMGVWGENPLQSNKWGFIERFVYVGYEDIDYQKEGLNPRATFKKNYHKMLTGMTVLACIIAVYTAYSQSFKGKTKRKKSKRMKRKSVSSIKSMI